MGVREDAIDMVSAVERADDLSLKFRREVGLGDETRAYDMVGATPYAGAEPMGLVIEDVDLLLRRRNEDAWNRGFSAGASTVGEQMRRERDVELGQYVGAMCDLASSDMLAHVVTAAVKAQRGKATRQEIIDAVIAAAKSEGQALHRIADRARRGELFS